MSFDNVNKLRTVTD